MAYHLMRARTRDMRNYTRHACPVCAHHNQVDFLLEHSFQKAFRQEIHSHDELRLRGELQIGRNQFFQPALAFLAPGLLPFHKFLGPIC